MRKVEELGLEQIGDQLCIVFKEADGRTRGILGAIDPAKLHQFAEAVGQAARTYSPQSPDGFKLNLLE